MLLGQGPVRPKARSLGVIGVAVTASLTLGCQDVERITQKKSEGDEHAGCFHGKLPDLDNLPAASVESEEGLQAWFEAERERRQGRRGKGRRNKAEKPGVTAGATGAGAHLARPLPTGQAGLDEAVRRLKSVTGIRPRVVVTQGVQNAAATAGTVMYNPRFFAQVRRLGGDSAVLGILAHEFGHLTQGHVYRPARGPGGSHRFELEADAAAGCSLAKMKINKAGYVRVTSYLAGGGSWTHPDGDRRADAIERGYARCEGKQGPEVAQAPRAPSQEEADDGTIEGPDSVEDEEPAPPRGRGRFGRPDLGGGDWGEEDEGGGGGFGSLFRGLEELFGGGGGGYEVEQEEEQPRRRRGRGRWRRGAEMGEAEGGQREGRMARRFPRRFPRGAEIDDQAGGGEMRGRGMRGMRRRGGGGMGGGEMQPGFYPDGRGGYMIVIPGG